MTVQTTYTVEERAANRRKWIAAARSGECPQGFGGMHRDGCYCFLGLGAKVLGWDEIDITDGYEIVEAGMGLWCSGGGARHGGGSLISLNDDSRLSLPQIADYFEANMPAYLADEDAEWERNHAGESR